MRHPPSARRYWPGLAVAAALGMVPAAAAADAGRVFSYSLGATVQHDANLFRLAPGRDPLEAIGSSDKSDTLTTTSFAMGVDKAIGIQRVKLNLQLSNARYRQFRRLDNDGNTLTAAWAWAVGHRLHGDLSASRKTALSGFDELTTSTRNINTASSRSASAAFLVTPDWELFASVGNNESANSAVTNQAASYDNRSTESGLRYNAPGGHRLSLRQRELRSALVREDSVDLSASWAFSPRTQLAGSLGRTRRQAASGAALGSSATTGDLSLGWALSPKTQLNLVARQNVAAAVTDYAASTRVRNLGLSLGWAATPKTSLQFSVDRSATRYSDAAAAAATAREDRQHSAGLSLAYRPQRAWSLSFSLRDEARDSNLAGLNYRTRLVSAAAEFAF